MPHLTQCDAAEMARFMPYRSAVTVLADIETPTIGFNTFEWLLAFFVTTFVAALVILLFTSAVEAFFLDRMKALEIVGLLALGALAAWGLAYLMRWVLSHTENGLSAIGATALFIAVALIAAAGLWRSHAGHQWKPAMLAVGVAVVFCVGWSAVSGDIASRTHFLSPHYDKPEHSSISTR